MPRSRSTTSNTVLLIRHTVAKFGKWKSVFDAHGPTRRAHGSAGGQLLRNADNPREIVIVLRWNDPESARRFAASDDLRQMMAQAGVTDMPDVYVLTEAEETAQ